jgi:hypothetical protein
MKYLLYTFCLVALFSCSNSLNKIEFEGMWYSKSGQNLILIKENKLIFYDGGELFHKAQSWDRINNTSFKKWNNDKIKIIPFSDSIIKLDIITSKLHSSLDFRKWEEVTFSSNKLPLPLYSPISNDVNNKKSNQVKHLEKSLLDRACFTIDDSVVYCFFKYPATETEELISLYNMNLLKDYPDFSKQKRINRHLIELRNPSNCDYNFGLYPISEHFILSIDSCNQKNIYCFKNPLEGTNCINGYKLNFQQTKVKLCQCNHPFYNDINQFLQNNHYNFD